MDQDGHLGWVIKEGDVGLDVEGPVQVQNVLVGLQQHDDEDEDRVEHEERRNNLVSQSQ